MPREIPALTSGDLDQRITLQQRDASRDSRGQKSETWINIATNPTVFAKARPTTAREFQSANATQALGTIAFTIRYRTDINADMRVLWRGIAYELIAPPVDPDGARHAIEMLAAQRPTKAAP